MRRLLEIATAAAIVLAASSPLSANDSVTSTATDGGKLALDPKYTGLINTSARAYFVVRDFAAPDNGMDEEYYLINVVGECYKRGEALTTDAGVVVGWVFYDIC